eukprot:TRINITY_DN5364_c0_g2_i1.p1 TRINITY_DN5364_c0_g2~~TRINITY_DN5364_c0_g2_i1.p1  ORF type:complete len:187 (-),score=32.12 TRINITY_DN5364_c0_g2_i1:54-590(-)
MAENQSLPKATIEKILKETLPPEIKCSPDTRDLILKCCVEFIHMVTSEASDICNKEGRKTISPAHLLESLKTLGFESYIEEVKQAHVQYKKETSEKPKLNNKTKNSTIDEEHLHKMQQEKFEKSRIKMRLREQQLRLSNSSTKSSTDTTTDTITDTMTDTKNSNDGIHTSSGKNTNVL